QAALVESKTFLDTYYTANFSPAFVEGWTAAGSPEQCIEELHAYFDAGVQHVSLRLTSWNQQGQLKRFLNEVAPAFTAFSHCKKHLHISRGVSRRRVYTL